MGRPLPLRTVASVVVGTVAGALVLSGCGAVTDVLFGPSAPERDAETGQITSASDADVFALEVGDCLDQRAGDEAAGDISSLPVVPCSAPHDGEIYSELDVDLASYPGEEEMWDLANEYCYEEFEGFVGIDYLESELDFWTLVPTTAGWADGDRLVQCVVDTTPEQVTGTLRDSRS